MPQEYQIKIPGKDIKDRHTHYEVWTNVGPDQATVVIRGDIASEFLRKYRQPITDAEKLQLKVYLRRNDELVKECQHQFKSAGHLIGAVASLDDIVYISNTAK